MTGTVYAQRLAQLGFDRLIPGEAVREQLNSAIFDELCQGVTLPKSTELFLQAIEDLKAAGAQCVILGCTEIPIMITPENPPLPILDTTRLLAKYAVRESLSPKACSSTGGWLSV